MLSLPVAIPDVDRPLFARYAGLSLPRHVSYPMPTWWKPLDGPAAQEMRETNAAGGANDLSLYLHIPFCEALCKFCACNRTILRKRSEGAADQAEAYLAAIIREIGQRGPDLGRNRSRPVRQIHWGGGTPTYLNEQQIERLHGAVAEAFSIAEDAEISIEVDPRVTTASQLQTLAKLGFNRISLGVQDFDPQVQQHVRRVQPFEMVQRTVDDARAAGFTSVNFDLIYGLPYQTKATVADTVERAISLSPDRVAFYHYAQIPDKIANQRGIHHDRMPDSDTKLTIFLAAVSRFTAAGYDFIGLDHFAKRDELLSDALRSGKITRNFQGMTTGAELDLVGLGPSAISGFPGGAYLQNIHDPAAYVEMMNAGQDPAVRGLSLTADDAVRQFVINQLYCTAAVVPSVVERRFGIDFPTYFSDEIDRLPPFVRDGLVAMDGGRGGRGGFELTYPLGRVLMRNVAAVFDAYLEPEAYRVGESRAFSASA